MHQSTKTPVAPTTFKYLKDILADSFGLEYLQSAYANHRGYINTNYEVELLLRGQRRLYYLRSYCSGRLERDIRFEHQLLAELSQRGFWYSPRLIRTRTGDSLIRAAAPSLKETEVSFVSLFSFVEGRDKYSWDSPNCTDEEFQDAARVLAVYHSLIQFWQPTEAKKERFVDKLCNIPDTWVRVAQAGSNTLFDDYFLKSREEVFCLLNGLKYLTEKMYYERLPHLVVHGDFHPGNLKFKAGKVFGVVDFDWSHRDARCFDVALAIFYFCTTWLPDQDGRMSFAKIKSFLASYQAEAACKSGIGQLDDLELGSLVDMLALCCVFIADWVVEYYYHHHPDPFQYLNFFRHCVRNLRWISSTRQELIHCIQSTR